VKVGAAGEPFLSKRESIHDRRNLKRRASSYRRRYGKAAFSFEVRELPEEEAVELWTVWQPTDTDRQSERAGSVDRGGRSAPSRIEYVLPGFHARDLGAHILSSIPADDPYCYAPHVWDLAYLARPARNGGEDTVQTYYGWGEGRAMTCAKGLGAAALSILTAWLIPLLEGEYRNASVWLVVALTLVGLLAFQRINVIDQSFIRAMVWLQTLRRF
jgi:hypothetical protein